MRTEEDQLAERYKKHPILALWAFVRHLICWAIAVSLWIWLILVAWDFAITRLDANHPIMNYACALAVTAGYVWILFKVAVPVMMDGLRLDWSVWRLVTGHHVRLPR